ncbi:hypothetical protein KAR28_02340 [Candidatus Parcubacteria bacterium]|nr:hypothetical protein [Candidatus Parcubacteria bacterium]
MCDHSPAERGQSQEEMMEDYFSNATPNASNNRKNKEKGHDDSKKE